MQASQETFPHDEFSDTAGEFREWRATRPRGARIPAGLWRSATALAEMHGVSRTSTALGLDYYGLKKRLGAGSSDASAGAIVSRPASERRFVEVSLTSAAATVTCAIEVEKLDGDVCRSKLRLELKGVALADLDALLRSVWCGRA